MTSDLSAQLAEVEAEVRLAAFRAVLEIPPCLSRAAAVLQRIRSSASSCPSHERAAVLERLKAFQSNLFLFSSAMERSARIFRGYSMRAGVMAGEYTPRGAFDGRREPAFFALNV